MSELDDWNLNNDPTIHFGFCKVIPSMLRFFIFKMSIVLIPWVHRVLFPSLFPEVQSFISSWNFKPNIEIFDPYGIDLWKGQEKFHFILLHIDIQFSKKFVSNAIFSPYFWHCYWKRSIYKYVDYNWFSILSHWLISESNYMSLLCSFYYKVKWGMAIAQQCSYCTWLFGITPGPLWFCVYPY